MMSLNVPMYGDYIHANHIYHIEYEIQDKKDTVRENTYLDLYILLTARVGWNLNYTSNEMIAIFILWTFHLYVTTLQQQMHMECISPRLYDISELVVPVMISLIKDCS
jgi:hypothetical protein